MKKNLFYLLCIAALLSSCGSGVSTSATIPTCATSICVAAADTGCHTCLYMIRLNPSTKAYELKRIDVAVSDENLLSDPAPTLSSRYHILRFHPSDDITTQMWLALWGTGVTGSRTSPNDKDFIQANSAVTKVPTTGTAQDVAIGYLDQTPLDSIGLPINNPVKSQINKAKK